MFTLPSIGRTVAAAGVAAWLVVGLVACASTGPEEGEAPPGDQAERALVPGDQIEGDINELARREEGRPAAAVDCPDLPAEVDSSIRCTLVTAGGKTYGVTVRATSVEGAEVDYDITVDTAPSR
jgi:hypothetical protein